jgi:hypothetical protein
MLAMAQDRMIVKPGDDARAAEHVVALLTKYAVRFDPVDRFTFYSGIVRQLAPIRAELQAQILGDDDERPSATEARHLL